MSDLRRYTIIKRLGNGAHGVVMKAKDSVTGKVFAIKLTYNQGSYSEYQKGI
jgi:serine/threonine protein kinase